MLSSYGRNEWLTILAVGLLLAVAATLVLAWWLGAILLLAAVVLVTFFRDPDRDIPAQRNAVTAPADGRVSSVHELEHFEPFDGPAVCVRIFLSVLDVHMNRCPCHGAVASIAHTPGKYLNALNPESAEVNESVLMVLVHPVRRHPVAAVRQVSGMLARTIVCGASEGRVLQRGERYGMIKLGSTTELYLPMELKPEVRVEEGQKVRAGSTVLAHVTPPESAATPIVGVASEPEAVDQADEQQADDAPEPSGTPQPQASK